MSLNETLVHDLIPVYEKIINSEKKILRAFRSTPFIISLGRTNITEFDIHSFIELGLRVVRFKVLNLPNADRIQLLKLLSKAVEWYCLKYDVLAWPIAMCIDVPNACVRSGLLANRNVESIAIPENSTMELTCDTKYFAQCDKQRIFIDDSYTFPMLVPGTEITINFGEILLFVSEKIDDKNIKCKVFKGGNLLDVDVVCFRGVKHLRPAVTKADMEILEFAKSMQFDMITINSVRRPETVQKIRSFFKDPKPLLISTICEQEGLDNIDAIIQIRILKEHNDAQVFWETLKKKRYYLDSNPQPFNKFRHCLSNFMKRTLRLRDPTSTPRCVLGVSDGIVLARDFIHHEIVDKYKIIRIQLLMSAKCRQAGKPFYVAGNVLEGSITGITIGSDLNDITNAVLQRTGFDMRQFKDPVNLVKSMRSLHNMCRGIEQFTHHGHAFRRLLMEYKAPVDAAQATVLGAILLAKLTKSVVIIVLTVTGRTVKQLVHMSENIIVAVTASTAVARQLQLYYGVVAIIYEKKALRTWEDEMEARIQFAVEYGMKFEILQRGSQYVVLRKSSPTSSYCDEISACQALTDDDRVKIACTRKKTVMSTFNLQEYDRCD